MHRGVHVVQIHTFYCPLPIRKTRMKNMTVSWYVLWWYFEELWFLQYKQITQSWIKIYSTIILQILIWIIWMSHFVRKSDFEEAVYMCFTKSGKILLSFVHLFFKVHFHIMSLHWFLCKLQIWHTQWKLTFQLWESYRLLATASGTTLYVYSVYTGFINFKCSL